MKSRNTAYTPTGSVKMGDAIRVTAYGMNDYAGKELSDTYTVGNIVNDISKQRLDKTVSSPYTGDPVEITPSLQGLTLGTDYEVECYWNNTVKGKASAILRGIGRWKGARVVSFTIAQQDVMGIYGGIL